MVTIYYYCDLHNGADRSPTGDNDVAIYGTKATQLQKPIIADAVQTNVDHIIVGGDLCTYDPSCPTKHANKFTEAHRQLDSFDGDSHIVMGNHDPLTTAMQREVNVETHSVEITPEAGLIVCQPDVSYDSDCNTIYSYDADTIMAQVSDMAEAGKKTIILSGHWAFDRPVRGYENEKKPVNFYHFDEGHGIHDRLVKFLKDHDIQIVTLHGHEHRYEFNQYAGGRYTSSVMPALTQEDVYDRGKPCGLFLEINIGDSGTVSFIFKKVTAAVKSLSQPAKIETVTENYMDCYRRGGPV